MRKMPLEDPVYILVSLLDTNCMNKVSFTAESADFVRGGPKEGRKLLSPYLGLQTVTH